MATTVLFSALQRDHAEILDEHRAAIADLRAQMMANEWLRDGASPLETVQEILDRRLIPSDLVAYQEAIAVVMGDEIIALEGYRWLTVTFDGVAEPAVCHFEKSVFISPISAVLKRFARGETQFEALRFVHESIRICRDNAEKPHVADIRLT